MKFFQHIVFKALVSLMVITSSAIAESQFKQGLKYATPEIVSSLEEFQPQKNIDTAVGKIGVFFKIKPGWHIYWKNSGEAGLPTKIEWETPANWNVGETLYPSPTKFKEKGNVITYGYKDQILLLSNLYGPAEENSEKKVKLKADITFLVCKDICIPGKTTLTEEFKFSKNVQLAPTKHYKLFKKNIRNLPLKSAPIKTSYVHANNNTSKSYGLIEILSKKPISANTAQVFPYSYGTQKTIKPKLLNYKNKQFISFPITEKLKNPFRIEVNFKNKNYSASIINRNKTKEISSNIELLYKNGESLTFKTQKTTQQEPTSLNKSSGIFLAIISAFLAGILLNLMPCVLPVISIKATSLTKLCDKGKGQVIFSSLAFTAGILSTFFILALFVILLQFYGQSIGWGFQFQYPGFVFVLLIVVFILSLSFFDFYQIQIPFLSKASVYFCEKKSLFAKSFFDGVLATLLSTPCTAPMLGTALAFAFSKSPIQIILVFLSIGFGLAFPYLLLSISPKLQSFIPKPGEWMTSFKHLMGLLLMATCIWLFTVLQSLDAEASKWALWSLVFVAFVIWGLGAFKKKFLRLIILLLAIIGISKLWPLAIGEKSFSTGNIKWNNYSEQIIQQARNEERPIFIDFTADWCITCKANEFFIINTSEVQSILESRNYYSVMADWTNGSDLITNALQKYGGNGVPHYVLIPPDGNSYKALPTVMTKSSLIKELKNLN